MKLRYFLTMLAATALYQPSILQAQAAQDLIPMPQSQLRSTTPGNLLSSPDPALPSRRVPSLTPPHVDGAHPLTPDEAWSESLAPPDRPATQPDASDDPIDNTLLDKSGDRTGKTLLDTPRERRDKTLLDD